MSKAQQLLELTEGSRLDYWKAKRQANKQARVAVRGKKAALKREIRDVKAKRRGQISSIKSKRDKLKELEYQRYQAAKTGRKTTMGDLDRQIKQAQYALTGRIPGKSGVSNARSVAALPPGRHSDINYDDAIDVEWSSIDPKEQGSRSTLALPPGRSSRGRGRPRIHPVKQPSGRGRGRPPKNVSSTPSSSQSSYPVLPNAPTFKPVALLTAKKRGKSSRRRK